MFDLVPNDICTGRTTGSNLYVQARLQRLKKHFPKF